MEQSGFPFCGNTPTCSCTVKRKLGVSTAQQLGLEAAGRLLSLDEEGADHHRALDDSRLTARILSRIYEAGICSLIFRRRTTNFTGVSISRHVFSAIWRTPPWIMTSCASRVNDAAGN